jgi:YfiH family protein
MNLLRADALGQMPRVRHAFFTREGGVSGGVYASLNCGFGSGDVHEHVATNRARASKLLGIDPGRLCTVRQHHGTAIVVVDRPWLPSESPRADAMASSVPGVALGVLGADCAAILLADPIAGVIGAAHAGWRGALAGIVVKVVQAMVGIGARPDRMAAAIGPCIGAASYEVGPEFPAPFLANDGANQRFFREASRPGHFLFDLRGMVGAQLIDAGIGHTTALDADTFANPDTFFSYRHGRSKGVHSYGRALSAIALA